MLTSARFLGAFPVSPSEIPASVLATVIEQLALEPATDVDAYFAGSRRIRHLALIRTHCGFTDFGDNAVARFRLTRSEEHTSELQSLMRISYAVFCLKKKNTYLKK